MPKGRKEAARLNDYTSLAAFIRLRAVLFLVCSASPLLTLTSDLTAQEVSTPFPGLRLAASLDQLRLQPGRNIQLNVELRNERTDRAAIPGGGRCSPALQLAIWGAGDGVVWAQGLPLCLEPQRHSPILLAPGSSVSATQCFSLAADSGRLDRYCVALDLPPATYWVGASFHGMPLPRLKFTLAR